MPFFSPTPAAPVIPLTFLVLNFCLQSRPSHSCLAHSLVKTQRQRWRTLYGKALYILGERVNIQRVWSPRCHSALTAAPRGGVWLLILQTRKREVGRLPEFPSPTQAQRSSHLVPRGTSALHPRTGSGDSHLTGTVRSKEALPKYSRLQLGEEPCFQGSGPPRGKAECVLCNQRRRT